MSGVVDDAMTWSTSVCSSATFDVDDVDADADVCGAPPAAAFDALQPGTSQLLHETAG